ncbi:Scr1 family TA system antitoxin-like transcriptional regulator [Actinomadura fulvescens]
MLLREVGSPEIMRGQLQLLTDGAYENITVQVVPMRGDHLGNASPRSPSP